MLVLHIDSSVLSSYGGEVHINSSWYVQMLVLNTDSSVLSSYGGQVHINSSGLSSYVGVTYRQFMVEFICY